MNRTKIKRLSKVLEKVEVKMENLPPHVTRNDSHHFIKIPITREITLKDGRKRKTNKNDKGDKLYRAYPHVMDHKKWFWRQLKKANQKRRAV